jgi:single-stranded DNA-binding protein
MGKGTLVYVEGNAKQREYQKDGQTRQTLDVNAQDVLILKGPNQQQSGGNQQAYADDMSQVPF